MLMADESSCKQENLTTDNTDMMYLKRQEQRPVDDGARTPSLARHLLRPTPADCTTDVIEVGFAYLIDHTKLPPNSPIQLKSVRAVIVSEKSEVNVSVRFPSTLSLHTYFSNRHCGGSTLKSQMYPALDEKFVMGSDHAGEVLFRRLPSHVWHSRGFWVVPTSMATETISSTPAVSNGGFGNVDVSKKGTCWPELKCNGMVQWGVRRQVQFIGKHREMTNTNAEHSTSSVKEEEEEEEDEAEAESHEKMKKSHKRKWHTSSRVQKVKKAKREKLGPSNTDSNQLILKNSKDRWSTERYKRAEENMLEILKAKGAVFGNPILRPVLRSEARKQIGDTGLLDHLLKHMAGKVAPRGAERFRRRHNADGAMEYWLESADLVNVRKEAGVQDPYWIPPPGWKPGDSPTQDPICAKELKQLKEEMAAMKRDMQEMVSKKQEECQAIITLHSFATNQNLDHGGSLLPLKEMYEELVKRKAMIEEQLMDISNSLSGMEEEMGKLTYKVEEAGGKTESSLVLIGRSAGTEKEKKGVLLDDEQKGKVVAGAAVVGEEEEEEKAAKAEKAAKIQRLKSGFRICRPQGTFLWPNMASTTSTTTTTTNNNNNMLSPQPQVVVPTPPSVSSATSPPRCLIFPPPPPPQPQCRPSSPVRPLAERRPVTAVTTTASTVVTKSSSLEPHGCEEYCDNVSAASTQRLTTLINLNEVPASITTTNDCNGFCGTSSSSSSTSQRRHTSNIMPHVVITSANPWEVVGGTAIRDTMGYGQRQQMGYSSSSSSSSSCLSMGVRGTWLALATPNRNTTTTTLDNSNRG